MSQIQPVNATQPKIDAYLGAGEYQVWKTETAVANKALAEFEAVKNLVPVNKQAYLAGPGGMDADVVFKAGSDVSWGIEQVNNGKKIDPDQIDDLRAIRDMAMEAMSIETGAIKGALVAAALGNYLTFQFNNAQKLAAQAIPKIEALKTALAKAERESTEARVQQVANLGITIITWVFLPELKLIQRVGVAVGQWAMDKVLGTDKSTPTRDKVSDAGNYAQIGGAAIEDWKWLTPAEKDAVKSSGKALAIVGMYFDQDEVSNALAKEQAVRVALHEAVDSLRKVKALIERLRPGMVTLRGQLIGAAKALKEAQEQAAVVREEYRDAIHKARWSSISPVVWRTVTAAPVGARP